MCPLCKSFLVFLRWNIIGLLEACRVLQFLQRHIYLPRVFTTADVVVVCGSLTTSDKRHGTVFFHCNSDPLLGSSTDNHRPTQPADIDHYYNCYH